jgi:DNA-binding GntR family transcriptional regulator
MSPDSPARSLAEQIADRVAYDIVNGHYAAGEKINETRLATSLGVSRGPVRDALALLERNMLVTVKPRSYTMVNRLTVTELEHVFTFREHVLGIASQYAARNRTNGDLNNLRQGLDRVMVTLEERPASYAVSAFPASQLWDLVIDASHSHVVRQGCLHFTGSNIWATAIQRKISADELPGFQKARISYWRRLFGEIEARNEAVAYEAGASLVRNNWKFMKKVFVELFPAD